MVNQSHTPAPSQDPVTEISAYLAAELQTVDRLLEEVLQSESPMIREIGAYIRLASGKKLRPMMTMLTARAFGAGVEALPVRVAAAMEAIHVATLLHDDVIDKASVRRGVESVNARWGDDVAILMADFLFASAFDLALHQLDPEPLRLLTQVTRRMCEGEMLQIERRGQWLAHEDYMSIIRCKTAYLFSACCALGAMSAGLTGERVARITEFGLNFGMAFQITDDTLDYMAVDNHWGKEVGIDLAAGKQTLPLLLTMQSASADDRARVEAIMNNGRDVKALAEIFNRYDAIERSLETARDYAAQAIRQLDGIPVEDEPAREHLRSLADYVVNRRF